VKILYLSPTGALGGAERVLLSVLKGVRRELSSHPLLLSLSDGPLVQQAAELGVDVNVLRMPAELQAIGDSPFAHRANRMTSALQLARQMLGCGSAGLEFLRRLKQWMRRARPDLIHSNGIKTHCLAWLAGPKNVPILWHAHDFFGARPLARRLLRLAARRVAAAVAVSSAVADDLKTVGVSAPVNVIANGTDLSRFFPAPQDGALLDRLAGLQPAPPNCMRIGLVATYARWKGQTVFLESAACLKKMNAQLPCRFYIVGGPIYDTVGSQFALSELQALARQLEIGDRVGFIGFQKDVAPIYRALDIVVHASTAPEPFGLTIIEAMACGKAVVATFAGGVVDIIHPGHDAFAVPPADPEALALALQKLLREPEIRNDLGTAAVLTVRNRFSEERIGMQFLKIYGRLTNNRSGASSILAKAM